MIACSIACFPLHSCATAVAKQQLLDIQSAGQLPELGLVLLVGTAAGMGAGAAGCPPLLGMLVAGYMLRNVTPGLQGIDDSTSSNLRYMALAIIMTRAGLGLDLPKLRENALVMGLLAIVPCFCEAAVVGLSAMLLFPVISLPWAGMLGFVIAAVSPSVISPVLLDLMSQGYGAGKGIPSVLLAAGSINGVVSIVLYSILWEFAWETTASAGKIVELIAVKFFGQIFGAGVGLGWLAGFALACAWSRLGMKQVRFAAVLFTSLSLLFGLKHHAINMSGGGTLAVLTFGATVQHYLKDSTGDESTSEVSKLMATVWYKFGQVMLFTLLGASIDQSKLDGELLKNAMAVVLLGLVARSIATFASCASLHEWTRPEKAFVALSWCPKATIQAALATRALDHIRSSSNAIENPDTMTARAEVILTTAVLSIVLTAPLFATLMSKAGRAWLDQKQNH